MKKLFVYKSVVTIFVYVFFLGSIAGCSSGGAGIANAPEQSTIPLTPLTPGIEHNAPIQIDNTSLIPILSSGASTKTMLYVHNIANQI